MFILFFCGVIVLSTFSLSLIYYNVMLFVVLLQCFVCVRVIKTGKEDLIDRRYQIMGVTILKN